MNLASSKVFKGLAVGSLALAISGVATIPASFAADPAPAASQSSDARTIALGRYGYHKYGYGYGGYSYGGYGYGKR